MLYLPQSTMLYLGMSAVYVSVHVLVNGKLNPERQPCGVDLVNQLGLSTILTMAMIFGDWSYQQRYHISFEWNAYQVHR
jgi:hypothetical protein